MVTIFATLGWEPKSVIPSLKIRDNVEKLIVYHSPDKKGESAYEKLWEYCSNIKLPLKSVKLENQFDLIKTAKEIRKDLRKYAGKEIIFNITGGTKVMSSAALLACILEAVPAVYCNEKTGKEETLPLLQIRYEDFLTKPQKNILTVIKQLGGECNAVDIAKKTGLRKATVSHHIKQLEEAGLVVVETSKKDTRKKSVKLLESVELLLE
ncbi:MAG: CRISPR-associated CARF protein Csa3 [Nanoarchaeota archaeon]|nr:CRISPR-associated CARF protein Csa3 [Nanoarchaeota archaeon]